MIYENNQTFPFAAYVANLGKYTEGELKEELVINGYLKGKSQKAGKKQKSIKKKSVMNIQKELCIQQPHWQWLMAVI